MTGRLTRSLPILLIGCALLAGCPSKTSKVGVILPLTGEADSYGNSVRKGIEVAYDELQADGESPIELLEIMDTESDPEKAAELLASAFRDSRAIAAIGGVTSGEAKAMLGVADDLDRVLISPSASSPELTGASRNFYRIWPSDYSAANKMAQSAATVLNVKTVVVIAESQDYARGIQGVFQPAFEELGGEVLEIIEFPPGTSDLDALVSRAVDLEPDGVYLAGYARGIGSMIQTLRDKDYGGRILTTSAFATPAAIGETGDAAANVFLTQTVFDHSSEHAHIQRFVNAYREKYDETPDIYAAHGYDTMLVLGRALTGRPGLPDEVKKGLRDEIKEYPGVTGAIQFDEKGEVQKFPRLYKISSDLTLVDYNEEIQALQERARERQEEIRRRLERLRQQAGAS